ncbi:hypothetical protein GGH94_001590 [Coemansia aciculifera]|uniref:Methionine synthase reductase n=1 Tax=Coemansia aciculifera TaxID=417176 RepID=A0A9W8IQL6_9FUNG|nr:hypothetical protein GGH94_001590 [Coemansia aciculifera]KAJ2875730.1 hypothetical protein GGH93_001328 [Coemansia aciculifera]
MPNASDSSGADFVDSQVTFLYASQTGNAESISYNMYEEAAKRGFNARWHVLDDHEKFGFNEVQTAVFVVSTTGDGDPPDNSARFWRILRKATRGKSTAYSHLRYAILGLGDTNYSNFCNTAQRLDKQLLEAGATAFYPKGLADDGTGLEEVVESWIEGLWPALARVAQCAPCEVAEASGSSKADAVSAVSAGLAGLALDSNTSTSSSSSAHQPLVLDFRAMESLKAITGTPRVPSAVCEMVSVDGSAENTAPPLAKDLTCPPWYAALTDDSWDDTSLAPFLATLQSTTQLTSPEALKRTLLVELSLSGADHVRGSWQAGDSFNIYAPNDEVLVRGLLERLAVSTGEAHRPVALQKRDAAIELPTHLARFASAPASLFDILLWACDVCAAPRKQTLRALADHCTEVIDRDRLLFLSSRQGVAVFDELRRQAPTTLDLLHAFPSCHPPVERLLELLPPLAPRSYSICNAPTATTDSWRFAFNVVEYCIQVEGPDASSMLPLRRRGVCTPWLERLPCAQRILVAKRRNVSEFRMPAGPDQRPIIMVGPGTGVAPFIGFLEQRAQHLATAGVSPEAAPLMWLFFGCRSRQHDFLFSTQIEQWQSEGVLSRLSTCFSRDSLGGPKYVQHAMAQHEDELMDLLLTQNALLFVCGDAKGMGKDVNDALADMLCRYSSKHSECFDVLADVDTKQLSKVQALQVLMRWSTERRYLRDLWA